MYLSGKYVGRIFLRDEKIGFLYYVLLWTKCQGIARKKLNIVLCLSKQLEYRHNWVFIAVKYYTVRRGPRYLHMALFGLSRPQT